MPKLAPHLIRPVLASASVLLVLVVTAVECGPALTGPR